MNTQTNEKPGVAVTDKYFYCSGNYKEPACAIDRVSIREDGVVVGYYSQKTQEEMVTSYPEIKMGDVDTVIIAIENYHRTSPKLINEGDYFEMLYVLPPMEFTNQGHTESFKLQEFTAINITDIYVRVGCTYFHMKDSHSLTHDEILQRVVAFLSVA